uniref:DNA/RNA non-specific endonuclease n=1 Tax=Candidatus Thiosymbion oneisti TaxID=589554 RepID=UPI00114C9EDA
MTDLRKGYDPEFLGKGVSIALPKAGLEIEDDILFVRDDNENGHIIDYIHYSVIMSKFNNQALVSAANLDQNEFQQVSGRDWFVDPRIGLNNQVGPAAYKRNPWDRGHLTRRTAVTWGSKYKAKRASNDSCSYANASMQHENFNQDEWRVPERIVQHLEKDKNGRITIFTGPVFTQTDRWYTRRTLQQKVRIPSGFWKVVAYIGKESEQLESQAYVLYQDARFLLDKRGQHSIDIKNHQVTITEIEQLTGLEFDEALFNSNPLYFYPREGINDGPEGFSAPLGTVPEELNRGVVFNREDAKAPEFEARRRIIPHD